MYCETFQFCEPISVLLSSGWCELGFSIAIGQSERQGCEDTEEVLGTEPRTESARTRDDVIQPRVVGPLSCQADPGLRPAAPPLITPKGALHPGRGSCPRSDEAAVQPGSWLRPVSTHVTFCCGHCPTS